MNATPKQFLSRLFGRLEALGRTQEQQELKIRREFEAARWMVQHTGATR